MHILIENSFHKCIWVAYFLSFFSFFFFFFLGGGGAGVGRGGGKSPRLSPVITARI